MKAKITIEFQMVKMSPDRIRQALVGWWGDSVVEKALSAALKPLGLVLIEFRLRIWEEPK